MAKQTMSSVLNQIFDDLWGDYEADPTCDTCGEHESIFYIEHGTVDTDGDPLLEGHSCACCMESTEGVQWNHETQKWMKTAEDDYYYWYIDDDGEQIYPNQIRGDE
jgi:hypothetical protein